MDLKQSSREEMKREAVARMKTKGYQPAIIESFEQDDAVSLAESLTDDRLLMHERDTQMKELADRLWKERQLLVYAGCLQHAEVFGQAVGDVWSLFCVQPDASHWPEEKDLMADGFETAFVIYPHRAELERIRTNPARGSLRRIG